MKSYQKTFGINVSSNDVGEVRTTCPQCSSGRKKPNDKCLAVNLDEGVWHCHHCGWSGSLGGTKTETEIRDYFRPNHIHADLPRPWIEWFLGRGIHQQTLVDNKISMGRFDSETMAVKFVYFKNGLSVNAKYRTKDKRFRQEKGAESCLYRFDELVYGADLVICEGEMDALSCYEAGIKNATSVPNGAPAPNAKNYHKEFAYLESAETILGQAKKVILAVDNDAPGKKLEQELARRIGVEKCWRVTFPSGCKDANDVLVKYGAIRLREIIGAAKPYPIEGIYSPMDVGDLVLHLYDQGEQRGMSTGWKKFDEFYTVKTGQMTVVTGIPSSGKSNWLDALLVNMTLCHDWTFAIFSPENWPIQRHIQSIVEKITRRSFTPQTGYNLNGRLDRDSLKACLESIADRFFFVMPEEDSMSVDTILEKARLTILRHGVRGIVIDPWNEIDHDFGNLTETQYVGVTLGKIRRFARRNDVHVWIVAHPQKLMKDKDTGKYKPPTMYEISGGANWRNKADVGICVHRPDMSRDETDVYVQKVRFREIGKLGGVTFGYSRECGIYSEIGCCGEKQNHKTYSAFE